VKVTRLLSHHSPRLPMTIFSIQPQLCISADLDETKPWSNFSQSGSTCKMGQEALKSFGLWVCNYAWNVLLWIMVAAE